MAFALTKNSKEIINIKKLLFPSKISFITEKNNTKETQAIESNLASACVSSYDDRKKTTNNNTNRILRSRYHLTPLLLLNRTKKISSYVSRLNIDLNPLKCFFSYQQLTLHIYSMLFKSLHRTLLIIFFTFFISIRSSIFLYTVLHPHLHRHT